MESTSEPARARSTEKGKGTIYNVLERTAEGVYTFITSVVASSSAAAIRKAGEDAGAGTYIAVPARSFVPTKVTVETSKVVKLGPA